MLETCWMRLAIPYSQKSGFQFWGDITKFAVSPHTNQVNKMDPCSAQEDRRPGNTMPELLFSCVGSLICVVFGYIGGHVCQRVARHWWSWLAKTTHIFQKHGPCVPMFVLTLVIARSSVNALQPHGKQHPLIVGALPCMGEKGWGHKKLSRVDIQPCGLPECPFAFT